MASSNYAAIPVVLDAVKELQPNSILDIGCGAGKYGVLFREYLDIYVVGADRGKRSHRIDGVDVFEKNISAVHDEVYDNIFLGDVRGLLESLGRYDLIFIGDVIEHFEKCEGIGLLKGCLDHADLAVLVVTPSVFMEQGCHDGNVHERHLSLWRKEEFDAICRSHTIYRANQLVVAMLRRGARIETWTCRHRSLSWLKNKVSVRFPIIRRTYKKIFGGGE